MTRRIIAVCVVALGVAGCGGGKNEDTTRPNVNVGYTGTTTAASIDSASSIGTLATSATAGIGVLKGGAGSLTLVGATGGGARFGPLDAVKKLAAIRRDGGAVLAGVVATATADCEAGGTMTLSAEDQDGDDLTTEVGDYFQVTFADCEDASSLTWGSMRLEITATDGVDFLDDETAMTDGTVYSLELTFDELGTVDAEGQFSGMDGDLSFGWYTDAANGMKYWAMFGTSFAGIEGAGETITNAFLLRGSGGTGQYENVYGEYYRNGFAAPMESYGSAVKADMCSIEIGGCLTVVTDPAWSQNVADPYPSSGTLRISDASRAFVEITAVDGTTGAITVRYDLDGPGGDAPAGPFETTWECLGADDSSVCFAM